MTVFTAEMLAVPWALRWVEDNKQGHLILCSDTAAALNSIKEGKSKSRPDLIVEILQSVFRIYKAGREVGFLWVPAHVGVKGNEEADEEAKKAVKEETVQINLQYGAPQYMEKINRALKERWQKSWEKERKGRAYFSIQVNVNKDRCTFRCIRKDDVAITRLRLGHCGLRSGLALIGKHPDGRCECGERETVKHVLLQWGRYSRQRRTLYRRLGSAAESVFNMRTLLNLDSVDKTKELMDYLHIIGVYKRISSLGGK